MKNILNKLSDDELRALSAIIAKPKTHAKNSKTPKEILAILAFHEDSMVRSYVAKNFATGDETLRKLVMSGEEDACSNPFLSKESILTLGPSYPLVTKNVNCNEEVLAHFSNSGDKVLLRYVAGNPKTAKTVLNKLAKKNKSDLSLLAGNPNLPIPLIEKLSRSRDKNVRLSVARNPSCPESILRQIQPWDTRSRWEFTLGDAVADNPNASANILRSFMKIQPNIFQNPIANLEFARDSVLGRIAEHKNTTKEMLNELASTRSLTVSKHVAKHKNTTKETLKKLASSPNWQLRMAVAENKKAGPNILDNLAKDYSDDKYSSTDDVADSASVRTSVAESEKCSRKTFEILARDKDTGVRSAVANNGQTHSEILSLLSTDKVKKVREAALTNPNTPTKELKRAIAEEKLDTYTKVIIWLRLGFCDEEIIKLSKRSIHAKRALALEEATSKSVLEWLAIGQNDEISLRVLLNKKCPIALKAKIAKTLPPVSDLVSQMAGAEKLLNRAEIKKQLSDKSKYLSILQPHSLVPLKGDCWSLHGSFTEMSKADYQRTLRTMGARVCSIDSKNTTHVLVGGKSAIPDEKALKAGSKKMKIINESSFLKKYNSCIPFTKGSEDDTVKKLEKLHKIQYKKGLIITSNSTLPEPGGDWHCATGSCTLPMSNKPLSELLVDWLKRENIKFNDFHKEGSEAMARELDNLESYPPGYFWDDESVIFPLDKEAPEKGFLTKTQDRLENAFRFWATPKFLASFLYEAGIGEEDFIRIMSNMDGYLLGSPYYINKGISEEWDYDGYLDKWSNPEARLELWKREKYWEFDWFESEGIHSKGKNKPLYVCVQDMLSDVSRKLKNKLESDIVKYYFFPLLEGCDAYSIWVLSPDSTYHVTERSYFEYILVCETKDRKYEIARYWANNEY